MTERTERLASGNTFTIYAKGRPEAIKKTIDRMLKAQQNPAVNMGKQLAQMASGVHDRMDKDGAK